MERPVRYSKLAKSPKILCAALLLLCVFPAIIYIANKINLHTLEDKAQQNASLVSQHVGDRINVINTLLTSMVGLHKASSDLDHTHLQLFSEDILKESRYIRNLGRYEKLTLAQNTYYPISMASPLQATVPGLVGTDLNAFPDVNKALKSINAGNQTAIVKLPSLWPLKGDLIAFRSVPQNDASDAATTPSAEAETGTHTGGFWLTLDIDNLFNTLPDIIGAYDVSIALVNNDTHTTLYSAQSSNTQTLFLSWLYPRKSFEELWAVSTSATLNITLEEQVGLTLGMLLLALGAAVLFTLVSCLYTAHILKQRQNEVERLAALQALFSERDKAEKTLNSVQDAIITLDPELCVMHINPAAVIQFNTRAVTIVGKPLNALTEFLTLSDKATRLDVEMELAALGYDSKKEFDVVPAGHSEEDFVLRMSLSSSRDHEGLVTGHVIVLRDISHERRLTRKLAYQANYDALTGCTNRYFFEQSLDRLIDEMPSTDLTHMLCYMDLDQFKVVNDTCGHRAGDQLLIELTKNLQLLIRDQDILSRLGGDEFGLIVVGTNKKDASDIADRIYNFFQKFIFTHQGNTFSVTASIGVVHIDTLCANSKDIMAAADIACYEAKDSGRNSMSVYSKSDEGMTERSEELNWLPRLQTALQNNEFRLHAQAVADLNPDEGKQAITHFEFLLRLTDEDGSEVTPWQFIQAAERYDLMRDIDRWVIRNALQSVAQNSHGAGSHCSFSINLSGQSAADPTLKSFIQSQFQLHQVDPSKIWFELTETAAISHFSVAVDLIKSIRSTGAKVALDDFGSGLSSFGYLKNLPVDVIKIDGQFVKEIVKNPIDREMVRAIHRVGESMNIETVAEFVEDQATVEELKRIGVNYAQGYHIGRPVPMEQAMAMFTEQPKAA